MFLIFGMRAIWRTKSSGHFHCPNEGADREYKLKFAQRFFTLFFIPLIPLGKLGEAVECQSCRKKFDPAVLGAPTSAQLAQQLSAFVRTGIVGVLRANATVTGELRRRALAILQRHHSDADESWIDADLGAIDATHLPQYAAALTPAMTIQGRESVLSDLAWVAAGGTLDAARPLLEQTGAALSLTAIHVRGIIDQVGSSVPPSA